MEKEDSFLGRGWSFPPTFNGYDGTLAMTTGEADIKNSLAILLSTKLGERVMQPEYGCNMDHLVFEAMNLTMLTYLKDLVTHAILYHEARIDLENVVIDDTKQPEGLLLIEVHYRIRTTNSRANYVYPFYINEGTNVTTKSL